MPDTDLTSFEARLRAGLVEGASHLRVSPSIAERVHAKVHRHSRGRRVAVVAFVIAVAVITVVAIVVPKGGSSGVRPAVPSWEKLGLVRPEPGKPVDFIDDAGAGVMYGVIQRGPAVYVARSTDGGAIWSVPGPNPCGQEPAVQALDFTDPEDGVATCQSSFSVTHDGGMSWRREAILGQPGAVSPQGNDPMFPVATAHGTTWALTLACGGGACERRMYTSTTGDTTWQVSPLDFGRTAFSASSHFLPQTEPASLAITGRQAGYVLLGGGHEAAQLYTTSDGWHTWTSRPLPCASPPLGNDALEMIAPSTSLLYLYCGYVPPGQPTADFTFYRSSDGGRTWVLRADHLPASFYRDTDPRPLVFLSPGPNTVLLQAAGTLIHSGDGGATWQVVDADGVSLAASWIHFSNANEGVLLDEAQSTASGFGWWATDDGGATWHRAKR
jgi:hypothetical protein